MAKRFDPTRTGLLRQQFEREVRKRLRSLKLAIVRFLLIDDELGLVPRAPAAILNARRFEFSTKDEKLKAFNRWLVKQADKKLLETDATNGKPWTGKYVDSAYRKGVVRGYLDARAKKLATASKDVAAGAKAEFLTSAFAQPERLDKLRLLGTRALEELRGVSADMAKKMSRSLVKGMLQGDNPRKIAREMVDEIDGLSRTRALLIARTEIIHAHAEGQLDAFEELGIPSVSAEVEWSTAKDDRVCEDCSELDGETYTLDEARGKIPLHPNCRCSWLPAAQEQPKDERKSA